MAWFRWHEGTATDPKFHLIARKSGQPVAFCIAVWAMLLERANAAEERGDISGFDCESIDAALGMPDGATQAIYNAMAIKGMILDERIAKWEERQPIREDSNSTQRSRECRERKRAQKEQSDAAQCNDAQRDATPCNAVQQPATQCNDAQRDATLDKIRIEENIKGNLNTPPPPPRGGRAQESKFPACA